MQFCSGTGQARCDAGQLGSRGESQDPEFLDAREARILLRVSQNTLYRHAAAGRIPGAFKIGGVWRFQRSALVSWVQSGSKRR